MEKELELEELDLSDNKIGSEGANYILKATMKTAKEGGLIKLNLCTLRGLTRIGGCGIDDGSAERIAEFLAASRRIQILSLRKDK